MKSADKRRENLTTEAKACYADLVTEYDQNTEKMLVSDLTSTYPDHKLVCYQPVLCEPISFYGLVRGSGYVGPACALTTIINVGH